MRKANRWRENVGGFVTSWPGFMFRCAPMARPHTTRLREAPHAAPPGAKVIDAKFEPVGKRKPSHIGRALAWIFALALAAAIGFLIPQLWTLWRIFFAEV